MWFQQNLSHEQCAAPRPPSDLVSMILVSKYHPQLEAVQQSAKTTCWLDWIPVGENSYNIFIHTNLAHIHIGNPIDRL